MAESTMKFRGIVSVALVILFIGAFISAILLMVAPSGKSDFPFFELYRGLFRGIHVLCGILMIPFAAAHLFFNYRTLLAEVKSLKK